MKTIGIVLCLAMLVSVGQASAAVNAPAGSDRKEDQSLLESAPSGQHKPLIEMYRDSLNLSVVAQQAGEDVTSEQALGAFKSYAQFDKAFNRANQRDKCAFRWNAYKPIYIGTTLFIGGLIMFFYGSRCQL